MVNFGALAAEISPVVWGTPANFNGFRALGSVTTRHSSIGRQPNFAGATYIWQGIGPHFLFGDEMLKCHYLILFLPTYSLATHDLWHGL